VKGQIIILEKHRVLKSPPLGSKGLIFCCIHNMVAINTKNYYEGTNTETQVQNQIRVILLLTDNHIHATLLWRINIRLLVQLHVILTSKSMYCDMQLIDIFVSDRCPVAYVSEGPLFRIMGPSLLSPTLLYPFHPFSFLPSPRSIDPLKYS